MSTANRDSESPQNSPAPKTARGVMNCRPCQIRKVEHYLPAESATSTNGLASTRGPKKESLSALIKRIDGLEELLKSDKTPTPPGTDIINTEFAEPHASGGGISEPCGSASSDISPFSNFRGNNFEASS
ncbi:unnamed protein product [Colletotrichum noveboracense]|uniref:Uncharacterized protein n=1 Tax=Colletotrichum noveboracense TaxID=2664923 RepID=A0A9W4WCZ2_9PEZI|nr:unnamed protein product [Colletotrichum noveboracense]